MHGVGSARWDQANINHGASGPRITLIDGIAVSIDLQRTIKVRAFFHWAFAVVFDHATPENRLVLVVSGLKFQPGVIGVHSTTGEKVPDLFCANYDIDSNRVSAAQGWLNAIQRSNDRRCLGAGGRNLRLRFFTDCKRSLNV